MMLSEGSAESMMLLDTLSAGAESAESIILSAPPAESMICTLSAVWLCYPFGGKPPKAREPLLFWRETLGTLVVDRPTINHQLTGSPQRNQNTAAIVHSGINTMLTICWKRGKTHPSLAADRSVPLLRHC
jgi:hypothetical protein